MTSLGLYIHIPFCRSRCDYCGFYSIGRKPTDRYIDALTKEMDLKSPDFEDRLCDTVYLGGGTPSSLSEAQLTRLMKTLSQHFRISDTAEITMEMNPCDMSESYLKNAMRAGVNRISIGVQEKHDHLLSAIGRRHTAKEAETAVKRAYRMGFHNLSLDLMYELPGQTVKDFEASLRWAVHLPVNHMSIYSLILEDGTRMAHSPQRRRKLGHVPGHVPHPPRLWL